jgi:hypothetical protein
MKSTSELENVLLVKLPSSRFQVGIHMWSRCQVESISEADSRWNPHLNFEPGPRPKMVTNKQFWK